MSLAWWLVPVVPATQEAEAGELLEPRRQRLQMSRDHATTVQPGDRARLRLKKKKHRERQRHGEPDRNTEMRPQRKRDREETQRDKIEETQAQRWLQRERER